MWRSGKWEVRKNVRVDRKCDGRRNVDEGSAMRGEENVGEKNGERPGECEDRG